MDVRVELEGADKLGRLFSRAGTAVQQRALDKAMVDTATTVLNESKRIVPVDKGTLRASGRVESPKRDSTGVEVEITYGGAASQYALIVHEDPNARHKNGQTYKYLERPVMEYSEKFVRSVLERFATYVKRGF